MMEKIEEAVRSLKGKVIQSEFMGEAEEGKCVLGAAREAGGE